jgi:HEAT repeat protein
MESEKGDLSGNSGSRKSPDWIYRGRLLMPALLEGLTCPDKNIRIMAAIDFQALELPMEEKIGSLISLLKNKDAFTSDTVVFAYGETMWLHAARALAFCGPRAVPALLEMLADEEPRIRERAVYVLGRIGPEAKPAMPSITQAVRDDDACVRWEAVRAICRIDWKSEIAVEALVETGADTCPTVQKAAREAMTRIGQAIAATLAAFAAAVFVAAMEEGDENLRVHAGNQLKELLATAPAEIPDIEVALNKVGIP